MRTIQLEEISLTRDEAEWLLSDEGLSEGESYVRAIILNGISESDDLMSGTVYVSGLNDGDRAAISIALDRYRKRET